MNPLYSFATVMALAFTAFYYAAAESEVGSGLYWAGPSLVLSMIVILVFNGGVLAVLLTQLALLVAIALIRVAAGRR